MLTRWPIRNKLLTGIGLLLVIVGALGWSGFQGGYGYRSLARSLESRAAELPLASELSQQVATLRITIGEVRGGLQVAKFDPNPPPFNKSAIERSFATALAEIHQTLEKYREELGGNHDSGNSSLGDSKEEWLTVSQIDDCLAAIDTAADGDAWIDDDHQAQLLDLQLQRLQTLAIELPAHLYGRLQQFKSEVHSQYHAWIVLAYVTSIATVVLVVVFIRLFYTWVFRPLRVLVKGSRRVAAGELSYRIELHTHDEMSELADAMNDMTARFQAIRDDLDRQVQERTKQVVRSEQLASVGFLAAGVAHEINNPLASIAMCAESLESRLDDLLAAAPADADRRLVRNYLQMIQKEAFRCKGITERLLDFSRVGDTKRQNTDLRELVEGVIVMVGHLEKYHGKRVEFLPGQPVVAPVNPQQIKQVVLNLVTNALDSVALGGRVAVEVRGSAQQAEMIFTDNGCGLSDEVREHLFEPFFTRRRTGQGIGLGLSITYRIIADHEGRIDVHSDGPDRGSQFRVVLPAAEKQKEQSHRYQAA
ncbi:MAG TPA: HAMP domain-containing sensor histidine kinase [Pirellulales bacterium]|nr:HAMP domain-containing sensor histidine kinase [Pirellulales bacterium]